MSLPAKFVAVGLATLASRIGGFLRDALIAALLGTGAVADAVFAAFLLPNLFRRMLTEGAFNAAFIPVFARREATGGIESAKAFAGSVLKILLLSLAALSVLAIVFMPQVVMLLVGGYHDDFAKFADTVLFSRIAFAYVVAITLTAFFAALLNSVRRYRLAAIVPVLFNLVLVVVLVSLLTFGTSDFRATGLIIVSLIALAGLVQLSFIVVVTLKERAAIRLDALARLNDPDVWRFALLLLPGVAVAGAGHVNMLVAVHLASAEPASVSWLYYADRLFQLPLGLVATSIGIVMLPDIAKHMHDGDRDAQRSTFSRSLEFSFALALPAAIALILLANPIVDVLYRHGSFMVSDMEATAAVLAALAFGLPAFALVKVFLPSFLAREQFRWPIAAALCAVAANVIVAKLLGRSAQFVAPAWGVTASAWINASVLLFALVARGEFRLDQTARRVLPYILAVSAITGFAIALLKLGLLLAFAGESRFVIKAGLLGLACLVGVAVQGLGLSICGILDMHALVERWRKRKAATPSGV